MSQPDYTTIDRTIGQRIRAARRRLGITTTQTAARAGLSPLFFPEGTFRRAPGLMSFRMGAFVCAVEAGLPVVPIVLRGTRSILTSGSWFPRRGRIEVILTPSLTPGAADERWQAALSLRDRVRAAMLPLTGERDAADARPLVKSLPAAIA